MMNSPTPAASPKPQASSRVPRGALLLLVALGIATVNVLPWLLIKSPTATSTRDRDHPSFTSHVQVGAKNLKNGGAGGANIDEKVTTVRQDTRGTREANGGVEPTDGDVPPIEHAPVGTPHVHDGDHGRLDHQDGRPNARDTNDANANAKGKSQTTAASLHQLHMRVSRGTWSNEHVPSTAQTTGSQLKALFLEKDRKVRACPRLPSGVDISKVDTEDDTTLGMLRQLSMPQWRKQEYAVKYPLLYAEDFSADKKDRKDKEKKGAKNKRTMDQGILVEEVAMATDNAAAKKEDGGVASNATPVSRRKMFVAGGNIPEKAGNGRFVVTGTTESKRLTKAQTTELLAGVPEGKVAFVLMVSNHKYVDGALVMGDSLRERSVLVQAGRAELVILVSSALHDDALRQLALVFDRVKVMQSLGKFTPKSYYKTTFDKSYLFFLTDYQRVMFLDADHFVKDGSKLDAMFKDSAERLAKENEIMAVGGHDYFQTALMVIHPSVKIFADIYFEFRFGSFGYNQWRARDGILLRNCFLQSVKGIGHPHGLKHYYGFSKPWFDSFQKPRDNRYRIDFDLDFARWWGRFEQLHMEAFWRLPLDPLSSSSAQKKQNEGRGRGGETEQERQHRGVDDTVEGDGDALISPVDYGAIESMKMSRWTRYALHMLPAVVSRRSTELCRLLMAQLGLTPQALEGLLKSTQGGSMTKKESPGQLQVVGLGAGVLGVLAHHASDGASRPLKVKSDELALGLNAGGGKAVHDPILSDNHQYVSFASVPEHANGKEKYWIKSLLSNSIVAQQLVPWTQRHSKGSEHLKPVDALWKVIRNMTVPSLTVALGDAGASCDSVCEETHISPERANDRRRKLLLSRNTKGVCREEALQWSSVNSCVTFKLLCKTAGLSGCGKQCSHDEQPSPSMPFVSTGDGPVAAHGNSLRDGFTLPQCKATTPGGRRVCACVAAQDLEIEPVPAPAGYVPFISGSSE